MTATWDAVFSPARCRLSSSAMVRRKTRSWRMLSRRLEQLGAICRVPSDLAVSAHWLTHGTYVTGMATSADDPRLLRLLRRCTRFSYPQPRRPGVC